MEISEKFLSRLNENCLYRALGIRIEEAVRGKARSRLEPNPTLCWPFQGQPHGGVLFTLMDTTMATAVFSELDEGFNCATIQIDIQFTYPAKGDHFVCMAQTSHRTGHIGFVRGEIYDAGGRLLALGQGSFRIIRDEFTG